MRGPPYDAQLRRRVAQELARPAHLHGHAQRHHRADEQHHPPVHPERHAARPRTRWRSSAASPPAPPPTAAPAPASPPPARPRKMHHRQQRLARSAAAGTPRRVSTSSVGAVRQLRHPLPRAAQQQHVAHRQRQRGQRVLAEDAPQQLQLGEPLDRRPAVQRQRHQPVALRRTASPSGCGPPAGCPAARWPPPAACPCGRSSLVGQLHVRADLDAPQVLHPQDVLALALDDEPLVRRAARARAPPAAPARRAPARAPAAPAPR